MALDAEPLFEALEERFIAIPAFKLVSRKLKHWARVDPKSQPALFIEGTDREPEQEIGVPTIWHIGAVAIVYFRTDADPKAPPMVQVNQLLALIEGALELGPEEEPNPDNPLFTTLGGQAHWAWIGGAIRIQATARDNQGMFVVPIEIVASRTQVVT